jgi:hypothetical protein
MMQSCGDGSSLASQCAAALPNVLQVLLAIIEDEDAPAAARVSACAVILDRGFGKPLSAAEVAQQRADQARPAPRPFIIQLIKDGQVVESR